MVILMINRLIEEENEVKELINEWKKYNTSNKKYYNIPFPYDLMKSKFKDVRVYGNEINNAKGVLSYLKVVCDYYDNNDYVVDFDYCMGNFSKALDINYVKITEADRREIHRIHNKLKYEIETKEKENKEQ